MNITTATPTMEQPNTKFHISHPVNPGRYVWLLTENPGGEYSHKRMDTIKYGFKPTDFENGFVVGTRGIHDPRYSWPVCLLEYEHPVNPEGYPYDRERLVWREYVKLLFHKYDVWRIDTLDLKGVKWRLFIPHLDTPGTHTYVCTKEGIPPHCLKLFRTRKFEVTRKIREIENPSGQRYVNIDLRPGYVNRDPWFWLEEVDYRNEVMFKNRSEMRMAA